LRARFKSPAFSEEGEWRLLQFVHPAVDKPIIQFETRGDMIKPFRELNLGDEKVPIKKAVIGPTLQSELSKHSVQLLFSKCGYPNMMVENSAVPLRW
jgi:hypothetical protein